ncbi:hypothetical protein [Streptomyces sp. NPDC048436]|uniref:hypothetical protein n=1 Tax=Streptomyces sp. NPDC048436 TaxID=3365550 RepID=UPI00371DC3A4
MSKIRHARHPQAPAPPQHALSRNNPHYGEPPPPAKGRRAFFWAFLAVQLVFLIWVVAGIASGSGMSDADALGTTTEVGLIVGIWLATDFILGAMYTVYRIAGRRPRG